MSYSEFVRSRVKSGEKIAEEMTPHKAAILETRCQRMVLEGDLLDMVKKYVFYNKQNEASDVLLPAKLVDKFPVLQLTKEQSELLHAASGVVTEGTELLDAISKHVFDGQPLDEDNIIEELGDLCFYLEAAMQAIKMKRADIEELNMAKLFERYKDGYSDQQAQERKDKQ